MIRRRISIIYCVLVVCILFLSVFTSAASTDLTSSVESLEKINSETKESTTNDDKIVSDESTNSDKESEINSDFEEIKEINFDDDSIDESNNEKKTKSSSNDEKKNFDSKSDNIENIDTNNDLKDDSSELNDESDNSQDDEFLDSNSDSDYKLQKYVINIEEKSNSELNNDVSDTIPDYLNKNIRINNIIKKISYVHDNIDTAPITSNTDESFEYITQGSNTGSFSPMPPSYLQPGDIIFMDKDIGKNGLIPGKEGKDHVAMYYGDEKIIQASTGGVRIFNFSELESPPFNYDSSEFKYGYVIDNSGNKIDSTKRMNAVDFVTSLIGSDYQDEFFTKMRSGGTIKDYNPNEGYMASRWYCSEIVWASYYNCYNSFPETEPIGGYIYGQGLDIDKNGWDLGTGKVPNVWPKDIFLDDNVEIYNPDSSDSSDLDINSNNIDMNADYQAGWNAAVNALQDAGYSDAVSYLNNYDSSQSCSSSSSESSSEASNSDQSSSNPSESSNQDGGENSEGDNQNEGGSSDNNPIFNQKPTVLISTYPSNGDTDESMTFYANASDPEGDEISYKWFATGQGWILGSDSFTTSFDSDGVKTIKVKVTDDEHGWLLTNSDSVTCTITEPVQPLLIQLSKSSVKKLGTFKATVTSGSESVFGANVTFNGVTKTTGLAGNCWFTVPMSCDLGWHTVEATKEGYTGDSSLIEVESW